MLPPLSKFVQYKGKILAFDPGETTGYAIFVDGLLKEAGQLPTHTVVVSVPILEGLLDKHKNLYEIVVEDYVVYSWKTESHSFDNMHTSRLIGCIETICTQRKIKYTKRIAQHAKKFVTDEKLKGWNLWTKGERHARDAIRHAIYHMIFSNKT